jgi:hypothetical protein
MPIEFQIGSIVAIAFFALSLLLSWYKRGILTHRYKRVILMYITWLISFLSYLFCCCLPMVSPLTHCLVSAVMFILIWLLMRKLFIRSGVNEQLDKEWQLYSSDYECVSANPLEFTWLDLNYYDTTQHELESLGFQKIDDFEFLHQTLAFPETRTFSRKFINAKRNIEVSIGHIRVVKPINVLERAIDQRIVEFSSEFSDGTFLETNNAFGVSPIVEFGGIELLIFEPTISLEKLLDAHEKKIETICETKKVDVVIYRDNSEMLSADKRQFLLICKDRQKKCGFTESETARLFAYYSGKGNDKVAKTYLAEYNRQARKRRKKN